MAAADVESNAKRLKSDVADSMRGLGLACFDKTFKNMVGHPFYMQAYKAVGSQTLFTLLIVVLIQGWDVHSKTYGCGYEVSNSRTRP